MTIASAQSKTSVHHEMTDDVNDKHDWRKLRLFRDEADRLLVEKDGHVTAVHLRQCFPWSRPGEYIALCDEQQREIALISNPAQLDETSRGVFEAALAAAGFVFRVRQLVSMETEFEIRNWKVITQQGPCTFQTVLDDWPRRLPDGGLLIKDVSGNLFAVPPADQLDKNSREVIWGFLD